VIAGLTVKSLRNRKLTAALTVVSIALAVVLLLGVERIRSEARESFASTVSGTDLIVGTRASPVQLLLFSVFHIGNATRNIRWDTYVAIASRPEVASSIPISLGDSHRSFRVLGTSLDYFEHFRYARDHRLELASGKRLEGPHDAVLGAEIARALRYKVGESIVIAHGTGEVSFSLHEDQPFRAVGVLAPTGTPVDRTVHVSLEGLDAIHAGHDEADPSAAAQGSVQPPGGALARRTISAFLVGLKSRSAALAMQRFVNEYAPEPLTAVLPGPTLQEVWELVGAAEKTLLAVSGLVVIVGLVGMLVALLTSLSERRREMAVLRSLGARPSHVFGLILGEAALLTLAGIALGLAVLYPGLLAGRAWLESRFGLHIGAGWPSIHELGLIISVTVAGVLIGLVPAYRIYGYSLADGMTIRV